MLVKARLSVKFSDYVDLSVEAVSQNPSCMIGCQWILSVKFSTCVRLSVEAVSQKISPPAACQWRLSAKNFRLRRSVSEVCQSNFRLRRAVSETCQSNLPACGGAVSGPCYLSTSRYR